MSDTPSSSRAKKPTITIPAGPPPTSLVIEDRTLGTGAEATTGATVVVHYVGVGWSSRKEFDASWERRKTFSFRLGAGNVIQGWERGVPGMKVGGRRQIVVPPELGYGARAVGSIRPNETLVFVVDLLEVRG